MNILSSTSKKSLQLQQRPHPTTTTRSRSSILSDEVVILDGTMNNNNIRNNGSSNHSSSNKKTFVKPSLQSKYGGSGSKTITAIVTAKCNSTSRRIKLLSLVVPFTIILLIYFITTIYYTARFVADDTSKQQQLLLEPQLQQKALAGFDDVYQRAIQHTKICTNLQKPFQGFDTRNELPFHNDTVASLPAFGIVNAIQSYVQEHQNGKSVPDSTSATITSTWPTCQMPPKNECTETQLSVIFMAYNPDRLGITLTEIKRMFDPNIFHNIIKEVVLVWNGERHVNESTDGIALLEYMKEKPIRIVYPIQMGFPNDLMNRYHPNVVQPTTKALLYYDDDGPFYSYHAIRGGFELWKRHSQVQVGAMARQIIYSPRQQEYKRSVLGTDITNTKKTPPVDNIFVSHCTNLNDEVDYEFHFFANYDANMVLPSGSILHSNYLCYLWHPIFHEIRQFVLLHPVHPDDMTVSMIVSQLAGMAPRVYSRKLDRPTNPTINTLKTATKEKGIRQQRRLAATDVTFDESKVDNFETYEEHQGIVPLSEIQRHRSLMFSICWDCGSGMTEMKQYWAELRTEAVNALVRYFGSINSGSIGWCTQDSEYYNAKKDGRCWPIMAKQGMLPWMNPDGSPKDTCP